MANKKIHKLYIGVKEDEAGPQSISVIEYDSSRIINDRPLKFIKWHSAEGNDFQWGFAGSGPADTALSILYDYTGDMSEAKLLYQEFKFDFIARMGKCLGIFGFEMDEWLKKKRKELYDDTQN